MNPPSVSWTRTSCSHPPRRRPRVYDTRGASPCQHAVEGQTERSDWLTHVLTVITHTESPIFGRTSACSGPPHEAVPT